METITLIHPGSKAEFEVPEEQAAKMLARDHGWKKKRVSKSKKSKNAVVDRTANEGIVGQSEKPENDCGCGSA